MDLQLVATIIQRALNIHIRRSYVALSILSFLLGGWVGV